MQASERRETILARLKTSSQPLSASKLAAELNVSRQIIVGDVALLRASGADISATPRGYVFNSAAAFGACIHRIACKHDAAGMEKELNIIVDNGCTVVDVIVEHPVYGEITGPLHLQSRYDIGRFIENVNSSSAMPLSLLTDGVHLHTISCPSEAAFSRVYNALLAEGIILIDT